ncbi:sulfatase [bacterium]|nr:sulfatase [bacterium]
MRKKMDRRSFIRTSAVAAAGFSFPFIRCSREPMPHILWIISEDTSPDLGCYGHPLVQTPHLDRLAEEGIRFTHAFSTAPVCSPSRSALHTGMVQTSVGVHQHRTRDKKPLPDGVHVITDYFHDAGYYTSNASGLQFDTPGKTDWNFIPDGDAFDGTDWRDRQPGQSFFSQVNMRLTHRPFERDSQNPIDPEQVELPPIYPDHPVLRRDWADYLESIQVLDRQIGQVLSRLEEDGLAENTVVFYFGDHGSPHLWAKQWLYEGGIRVPFIMRWPKRLKAGSVDDRLISLIDISATVLSLAGIPIPGYMEGRPFLGDQTEEREFIVAARDRCDETVDRIRCIRDHQYKYIRNFMPNRPYTQFNAYKTNQYPAVPVFEMLHKQGKLNAVQARFMADRKPEEELYDLNRDPFETNNLVEDPLFQDILDSLRGKLNAWIEETGDMGAIPENPDEIEYWKALHANNNRTYMENKNLPLHPTPEQHVAYWEKRLLNGSF